MQLQIIELFNPKTNLEKIGSSPNGPLAISNIMQKSGIEVNERGSVAYAATGTIFLHLHNNSFFFIKRIHFIPDFLNFEKNNHRIPNFQ